MPIYQVTVSDIWLEQNTALKLYKNISETTRKSFLPAIQLLDPDLSLTASPTPLPLSALPYESNSDYYTLFTESPVSCYVGCYGDNNQDFFTSLVLEENPNDSNAFIQKNLNADEAKSLWLFTDTPYQPNSALTQGAFFSTQAKAQDFIKIYNTLTDYFSSRTYKSNSTYIPLTQNTLHFFDDERKTKKFNIMNSDYKFYHLSGVGRINKKLWGPDGTAWCAIEFTSRVSISDLRAAIPDTLRLSQGLVKLSQEKRTAPVVTSIPVEALPILEKEIEANKHDKNNMILEEFTSSKNKVKLIRVLFPENMTKKDIAKKYPETIKITKQILKAVKKENTKPSKRPSFFKKKSTVKSEKKAAEVLNPAKKQ